jgi:hypothetical protein
MNKAIARNEAIYALLKKYKKDEDLGNKLSNGFIPESINAEYEELYQFFLTETAGKIDTDYDRALFSSWFYINDKKIIGTEKEGSGYINPVKTVGKLDNVDDFIPFEIVEQIEAPKINNIVDLPAEENQPRKSISTTKELIILNKIKKYEETKNSPSSDILSIEDSLKIYSPGITTAEIKGFVYFKQKFGSPMIGWEKWFLPTTGARGKVCYSTTSFYLKDQQFNDVKLVPSGAILGIKTKFKNEYNDEKYWVIKNENNELFYAAQTNFKEENSFATVDEESLKELVMQKGLCYDGNDYVPLFMFTFGDIYEIKEKFIGKYNKETDTFDGGYKSDIERLFGIDIAKWHEEIIDNALKTKNNFDFANPVTSERPYLSKENEISHSFLIKELNIDSGVSFKKHFDDLNRNKRRGSRIEYNEEETTFTLFNAFEIWFEYSVNDMMLDKTTVQDIKDYYISRINKKISLSDDESFGKTTKELDKLKDEKRILAKIEGDKFYSEFLATALTRKDLLALNYTFNKQFNNFVNIDLSKVPVGFEANNKIFNSENFRLKPVQRNGLAFLNVSNSGCLAYDVGFGKTLTAIHNLAMLLKQGSIKRPLIAVPKQVYKNWVYEMFGYWTNGSERSKQEFNGSWFVNGALTGSKYKLNDWFNLSTDKKVENKQIPEYTITLVTYQGLEKIGFSSELYDELAAEIFTILNEKGKEKTERQEEKEKERSEAKLGRALAKTEYDIDVLGVDYLVFDEAHAFKNIFSSIEIPEDFRNSWRLTKGAVSSRGLKGFILALYIQKKYNGNVNLLTATPFTNSPLELYSMLSLVAYNYLVTSKINNLFSFMSMFIETQVEYTVNHLQEIVLDTVIKSFKNKNILRDILYRYFDYQDNPIDAGVRRPCKLNLPNTNVSTFLQMSDSQITAQAMVIEEANSYDIRTNRGAMGRALSWAKSNSFSPFLLPGIAGYQNIDEFVEESPKIKYTIECIKSVKEFHENLGQECSGQVIYSNRGKDLFKDFKTALEEKCGFKQKMPFGDDKVDEVEIITSSNSEADNDRKELIKDAFNEGVVKVIIGTSTIQEGINLQKRGTVLYNLDLDWNPTSFKQLEGRIHRQGNMFKYVRIVVPMVQDTLDSFINQKLDEKSKRISSIWDKTDKTNESETNDALDPMEIKFNLIKDEKKLVNMRLEMNIEKAKKDFLISEDKYNAFSELELEVEKFNSQKDNVLPDVEDTFNNFTEFSMFIDKFYKQELSAEYKKLNDKKISELKQKISDTLELYSDFKNNGNWKSLFEFKRAVNSRKFEITIKQNQFSSFELNYNMLCKKYKENSYSSYSLISFGNWYFDALLGAYSNAKRIEKNVLKPYSMTMFDDFSAIKQQYKDALEKSSNSLEYMRSEDYFNIVLGEIRIELEKRQGQIGDLFDRVEAFEATNNLLTYPFVEDEADICEVPTDIYLGAKNYMKTELEVFDEVSDTDEKIIRKKLKKIQDFFNNSELIVVKQHIMEHSDSINKLYDIILNMPVTYETEEVSDKIAQLHYFSASSDWYIIELDKGDADDEDKFIQKQAFGFAILNNDYEMSEYGYMNIDEIKIYAELDLHFNPTPISGIISKYTSSTPNIEPIKEDQVIIEEPQNQTIEIIEAIELLSDLLSTTKGKQKKEIKQAIDLLKDLL